MVILVHLHAQVKSSISPKSGVTVEFEFVAEAEARGVGGLVGDEGPGSDIVSYIPSVSWILL